MSAADAAGVSIHTLSDAYSREVAEGYLAGRWPWETGDRAMNDLYAAAYNVPDDFGLSDFAWDVYVAFDEGEYIHADSPEMDGEPRTKALLSQVFGSQ